MFIKILKLLILTLFLLFLVPCKGAIYKWTDSAGRIHYDNNGANVLRTEFKTNQDVQSIKWQSAKVTFSTQSKSVNKQQIHFNKQVKKQCIKTTKRITAINKQLVKPLIAVKFDAFQAELRKLRWTKRKVC